MKCLYITYDSVLEPLGQSQVIPYLKGLAQKGVRFVLLSFDRKRRADKMAAEQMRKELDRANIKWVSLRYHKNPLVLSTIFDISCGLIAGLAIAVREKAGVVHARSYVSSAIALVLKKILGLKFIFDMRGFWADERVEGRIWAKKAALYRLVKSLERHFFKNADEIIVLTEGARRIIENWGYGLSNVSVIPCCADTDRFKFDHKSRMELRREYGLDGKFVFVHTGSLEYWYMLEEMMNYFKIAREIEPRAHFLILTRSDKDRIAKLAHQKKLDSEAVSAISVPYADMPKYLAMADAGLIFITPVFSKIASSPTKFAEYLSSALPVVVNEKIGDLEECVLKNNIGVVIRGFNEEIYRESFKILLELLRDENLRARCRQAACGSFSLNAGTQMYHRVYSRLG